MALTVRSNGSSGSNIMQAQWFNDFYNLFTGAMTDQPITFKPNTTLQAIAGPPAAPAVSLSPGTALGIGAYQYAVTFTTADGGETIPGSIANITTTTGNQQVSVTSIPTGPVGTTGRNLYRTKVASSAFLRVTTLADNSTTTYSDSIADGSLGVAAPLYPTFGGSLILKDQTGATKLTIATDGSLNGVSRLGYLTSADTLDMVGPSDTYLKARGGAVRFQPVNTVTVASFTPYGLQIVGNASAQAIGVPPTAPTLALAAGSTGPGVGAYTYAITFLTADGGETLAGTTATITTTTGNQTINLSAIPTGPFGWTASRNVYRSKVGTTSPLYKVATINDNTTTTYSDTTADASLTVLAPVHPSFGGTIFTRNNAGTVTSTKYSDGAFSYDTGSIFSNGAGILSAVGLVLGSGLANLGALSTTINGSTSGSFTAYETFTGVLKIVVIQWNNYKQGPGANTYTLNTAFTGNAGILTLGGNGLQFWNGGTQNTLNLLTALSSGGGSTTTASAVPTWSVANSGGAFTKVVEPGTNGFAATGITIIIGV